jgi:hypothetical protein
MRTLEEIQKDFDEITKQENALRERRSVLSAERRQVCKYQFEESHNVKHGDLIETKDGRRFFYDDIKISYCSVYIVCRTVKKNGQPSFVYRDVYHKDFADGDIKVKEGEK